MSVDARSYECLRGARDFAYAFDDRFLTRDGRPASPSFRYVKASCLSSHPLQIATITCAHSDLESLDTPSPYTNPYISLHAATRANTHASPANTTSENLTLLYQICMREGVLPKGRAYLFTALELDSGAHSPSSRQFKVFALDVERTQAQSSEMPKPRARAYENLSAQILIPLIMLPLGQHTARSPVSGVFLLDDWLAFYRDGRLAYECRCQSLQALHDALGFIASIYGQGHKSFEVFYPSDLLPKIFESSSNDSSPESHKLDSAALESNLPDSSSPESSPLSPNALSPSPRALEGVTFTPMPHSLAHLADDLLHAHTCEPLYNPHAKPIWQSTSFRSMLWLLALCALILALPFGKLIYAEHLRAQSQTLSMQNAQASQTLAKHKQLAATLPAQSAKITQTIESLSSIRAKYTPRLYILSTLSSIVRDSEAWIVDLLLQGQLERGETLLTLSCQALREESLHTLLSALQATPELEIISTEMDRERASSFRATITLKLSHV